MNDGMRTWRRGRVVGLVLAYLALLVPVAGGAQERSDDEPGASLDLTFREWGVVLGHTPRVTGLRINASDRELDRITGVNLTLWTPRPSPGGDVNGLALGLIGPTADRIRGVGVGGFGILVQQELFGIHLGGLGVVSEGRTRGASIGGLGVVSQSDLTGVGVGGLGALGRGHVRGALVGGLASVSEGAVDGLGAGLLGFVAEGDVRGVGLGGLGTISRGAVTGLSLGGLAVVTGGHLDAIAGAGLGIVSGGRIRGVSGAGLAIVARDGMDGIHVSGLATISQGAVRGIHVGGLGLIAMEGGAGAMVGGLAAVTQGSFVGLAATAGVLEADREVRGLSLAGFRTRAERMRGLHGTVGWVDTDDLLGLSAAAYHRIDGRQRGLTVGLFNSADELEGVQIGLLNRAGNNRALFRWLPIVNASF